MPVCDLGDVQLNYTDQGDGPPVVFAHALGCSQKIWEPILPLMPKGLRLISYDARGHGASSVPEGPYSMGALVRDAERLLDALEVRDCVFVGLSMGGMVAQGLAVKRLDQVRAMVLSNTAAKIGQPKQWHERANIARSDGVGALCDMAMPRWFTKKFLSAGLDAPWREMMAATPVEGYCGGCAAIAGTDFYTTTASLTLPTLAIAGAYDGTTPADLVRETADLVKGSRFHLFRNAGHMPCVEIPEDYTAVLTEFLTDIGHA
ncbi:MAG: 3-oxoadipate enol-lactonase [Planctomycetales bacterium]|nr:3-oxoadipate enol-lactonase [Planctomycetales bacterium]